MTPERYRRIQLLADLALKLAPDKRRAYLDQQCAGDEALRRAVESLLAAEEQTAATDFLETPAPVKFAEMLAADQSPKAVSDQPMILNERYLIERELGRGGLGVVYLAHDLKLHRRPVVIKVLQAGIGHSDYWKCKTRHEIEALARFQNPHIVGLLDTGELPGGFETIPPPGRARAF